MWLMSSRRDCALDGGAIRLTGMSTSSGGLDGCSAQFNQVLDMYLTLLEGVVTASLFPDAGSCTHSDACGSILPFDATLRFGGNDWPPTGLTMVGNLRLRNVRMAIDTVVSEKTPGDFVELGAWRGGLCLFVKAQLRALGQNALDRRVYVFDAFGTIIPAYGSFAPFLSVPLKSVVETFARFGLLDEGVEFIEGTFSNTLPNFWKKRAGRPISVLRLDGNHYDSYQDALYYLYELVPVGGIVIFDDIRSHPPVKQAWLDFQADQGFTETLIPIADPDIHGAWFKKTVSVKVVRN